MKKSILFVDSSPELLEFFRLLLESDSSTWDVKSASSGEAALEQLTLSPCDVVVANWRVPGLSAADLFAAVANAHPQIARVVYSDAIDQEEVARLLWGRHQFLPKPLDMNLLRSTIWRVCSLQDAQMDQTIEGLISSDYAVPTLPSLYFRVLRAMDSPDASLATVGEIIAEDPAIVAKVLQLVNSAYFGMARRISNPVEAVQILGLQKLRTMLLSIHAFSCFDAARMKSFPLSRLWNHSIAASQIAQKICRAERVTKDVLEEAQLACMLHDVGKVILASGDPDRYQSAVALALKRRGPLVEAEREVFGASHAEVGAFLLSRWGLPISVIEAIALHHEPQRCVLDSFTPLTAAHVATCLETETSEPILDTEPTHIDEEYLARIGLADRLPVWREAVEEVEALAIGG